MANNKMDIIINRKGKPKVMPPYNWYELGSIRNVGEEEQIAFCNTSIYQILPVKYLKDVLSNKRLRFNKIIKSWDDPYELFLLKQNTFVEGRDFNTHLKERANSYFGQCWSQNKDSDALWRIYSHKKDGVRIRTTVLKMILVLNQTRGQLYTNPLFGKVNYYSKNQVSEWIRKVMEGGSGRLLDSFSDSLFIKRIEFEHENEIRFVIEKTPFGNLSKEEINNMQYLNLEIDPQGFIEEIALDPRLDEEEYEKLKQELSPLIGNIPICKSDLYDFERLEWDLKQTPIHLDVIFH